MAEIVVGAGMSCLCQNMSDYLCSPNFWNFFRENKVSEGLLGKLKTTLRAAKHLHNVAEEKQFGKPEEGVRLDVRKWLFELLDAICAAEDLLELIDYKTLQYKHEYELGFTSRIAKSLKCTLKKSSKSFDDKVEEIHKKLEDIMKQRETYDIKDDVAKKILTRVHAPFADESKVFGRKDAKESIVSRLLSENSNGDKITVIPIVGMGGVGKTTLAQIVYYDDRVRNHFKVRAWVTVSEDFDFLKIMRIIFENITAKQNETDNQDQLSCKLREELKEKKFIIVLDDVWNKDYVLWDSLKSHLESGACGSKIIVTARSKKVAEMMTSVEPCDLKELSNDDCWSLFKEHVFGNANSDSFQDLHEIGREIVKKCKGLPLAVKALAGLLRSMKDREEWKKILANDIWELQLQEKTKNNILPSLWLSYDYLPSHLQPCFAYFSIFPKDTEITEYEKKKIVSLWMAEGLLPPDLRGRKAIQAGYEYFEDLISRSLLQRSSKNSNVIVMHDCVHDLAAFLSDEFCFSLDDNNKTKLSDKTRHFSYSRAKEYQNLGDLSVAKHLRTCLQIPSTMDDMLFRYKKLIIPAGKFLRALCLSEAHLPVFPDLVCNLKLLRYLDLSWNDFEQIPNKLCSLYNMQTLRLSYCGKLTKLPTDMGNLVDLCCLDIKGVPLHKMPHQMCNLKNLETLSQFVLGKNDCSNIKELGGLCHLSGKLAFKNLENVDDVEDVKVANLKDKKYLGKIEYHWSFGNKAGHSQYDVLDALQPHTNVKDIVISGYSGEKFSKWVGNNSYGNIVTMSISNCEICFLPALGQLPWLVKLSITQCDNVTEIGPEFYRESHSSIEPFRSLKVLKFYHMRKWKEWSFLEGIKDGCFPRLEELSIKDCPYLKVLQIVDEAFPSLKSTCIMGNCSGILESSQFWKSFSHNIVPLHFAHCSVSSTIYV